MELAAFLMWPCQALPEQLESDDGSGRPAVRVAAFLMRPSEQITEHMEGREAAAPPQLLPQVGPKLEHEPSLAIAPPRKRTLDELSVGFVPARSSPLTIALVCLLWIAALAGAGTASWCIARDIAELQPPAVPPAWESAATRPNSAPPARAFR